MEGWVNRSVLKTNKNYEGFDSYFLFLLVEELTIISLFENCDCDFFFDRTSITVGLIETDKNVRGPSIPVVSILIYTKGEKIVNFRKTPTL